jgi:DNA-directed RNA polymerase subunit omega
MARVTIEDCVVHIPNRFLLVQTAVKRARQIMEGARPLVASKNRPTVLALREIAAQKVKPVIDPTMPLEKRVPPPQPVEEEEEILDAAIEEVGIEDLHYGRSLSDLREIEGLPEDGFHEIGEEGEWEETEEEEE